VGLQDRGDEVSHPTPHVNEERHAREVIGGGYCYGKRAAPGGDAGQKELAKVGMLGKILEVPHAIDMVMGWLACCDAVQEFTVRRPPPLASQNRGAPPRAWHVGLE